MEEKNKEQAAASQKEKAAKPSRKEKKEAQKENQAKMDELRKKADELSAALAKEKDDYIRLMAEFENFRRRSAAERLSLIETASEKIILELLPLLDDCERALKALETSSDAASAKEGTELIYNKLNSVLKAKGLKEIEAREKAFDTEYMEAVAQFPAPDESKKGMVIDVIQKGYMLGEKVIRYAKVVVGQ